MEIRVAKHKCLCKSQELPKMRYDKVISFGTIAVWLSQKNTGRRKKEGTQQP